MSSQILTREGTLYRAVSLFRWPGSAATSASILWATHLKESRIPAVLDGAQIDEISASLADGAEADLSESRPLPVEFLAGNGVSMYGEGFVLRVDDPILERISSYEGSLLRVFVNGESLLTGRDSGRLAIDVNRFRTEDELFRDAPVLGEHLRATVKPVRDEVTSQVHDPRYWGHWDKREALFAAVSDLPWFVTTAQTTRLPVFLRQANSSRLFTDQVIVFATDAPLHFAVLSSAVHFAWFERMRTPRGSTSRYMVSRVLRPFPFPVGEDDVDGAVEAFEGVRTNVLEKYVSVTKLYNAFDDREVNDPLIVDLRDAQIRLDHEVCRVYGWDDLDLEYGFFDFSAGEHFTVSPANRATMRKRLLDLNRARLSEVPETGRRTKRLNVSTDDSQASLFGGD